MKYSALYRLICGMALMVLPFVGKAQIEYVLHFEQGSTAISAGDQKVLNEIIDSLNTFYSYQIYLTSHAYAEGPHQKALDLSSARNQAVMMYFINKNIPIEAITTKGWGDQKPLEEGTTPEVKLKNRRAELRISFTRKGEEPVEWRNNK